MKASEILVQHIKEAEGCRLKAYKDSAGVWTIGYGHTGNVTSSMVCNYAYAERMLRVDLVKFEVGVDSLGVCKTQGQFDALVDFAYNCGMTNLNRSTLLKYIRAGKSESDIRAQFARWNKAGGKVLPGLVKRRQWEADRFFS